MGVVGWVVVSALITADPRYNLALDVFIWVCTVVVAVGAWSWAFRPFLAVNDEGVIVQNPLSRYEIAWADIRSVTPGYYGIAIRRTGGRVVVRGGGSEVEH